MEVKMLSRKLIKPKHTTPDHLRNCKLSFFDQLQPQVYIPTIYFYPSYDSPNTLVSENCRRLETSFSEILGKFHPLAGRFASDGLSINCNDEGVEYLEAEVVNVILAELLSKAQENLDLLHSLVPWDIQKPKLDISPILGVQVTVFKCGGLAICTLCSHLMFDGFSGSTFFREWSVACRAGINEVMVPNFSVASEFPARDLSRTINKPSGSPFKNNQKMVTKRFLFHENTISYLKSEVRAKNQNAITPTRVEVLACAIWKVLISIDQAKHGTFLRDSTLCTSINLRGRTGIDAIPDNVFGNFYFQIPTRFKWANGTKMEDLELHHLVSLFSTTLKDELMECSKISNPNELVAKVANNVNIIHGDMTDEGVDFRFFNTLCKFPMYEVDFGWGKPKWIGVTNVPVDLVVLMDSKCGTKVEAMVSLSDIDMHSFETHPDIVAFTSL